MQGAALATIISWGVPLTIMLVVLAREGLLSGIGVEAIRRIPSGLREIGTISIPAVAAQILNPIAIAVITRLVSRFGDNAVAAYGIATRVDWGVALFIVIAIFANAIGSQTTQK